MTVALVNFRKSGMGDDADEEKKRQHSTSVFSNRFYDFTNNLITLDLMYDLFLPAELLESATCEMPPEAQFNSASFRRVAGALPTSAGKKGQKREKEMRSFFANMPPIKIHKTSLQHTAQLVHAQRETVKLQLGLAKLISSLQRDLDRAQERAAIAQNGTAESSELAKRVHSLTNSLKLAQAQQQQVVWPMAGTAQEPHSLSSDGEGDDDAYEVEEDSS